MSIEFKTGRGIYRLSFAIPAETAGADAILPLALERTDGIERVVFRCRIEGASASDVGKTPAADALLGRIAPIIQRDFETIREAALKSIRSERKLVEISITAP